MDKTDVVEDSVRGRLAAGTRVDKLRLPVEDAIGTKGRGEVRVFRVCEGERIGSEKETRGREIFGE